MQKCKPLVIPIAAPFFIFCLQLSYCVLFIVKLMKQVPCRTSVLTTTISQTQRCSVWLQTKWNDPVQIQCCEGGYCPVYMNLSKCMHNFGSSRYIQNATKHQTNKSPDKKAEKKKKDFFLTKRHNTSLRGFRISLIHDLMKSWNSESNAHSIKTFQGNRVTNKQYKLLISVLYSSSSSSGICRKLLEKRCS